MVKSKTNQIEQKILHVAVELAKKGEGALFVIGNNTEYELLLNQTVSTFSLFDSGAEKLLKSIAIIDGAVIINTEGNVIAYGAMIKNAKPFVGYGTRHAAAMTASKNKRIAILCSEEERKVKIFRDGKFIMQIDALQKNIEQEIPKVAYFLEALGAGLVGTVGASVLVPTMGIALIPGVIIFGASYYAFKSIINYMKN